MENDDDWVEYEPVINKSTMKELSNVQHTNKNDIDFENLFGKNHIDRSNLQKPWIPGKRNYEELTVEEKSVDIGKNAREINPYWNQNGTGLPKNKEIKNKSVDDEWVKKSIIRLSQQAKDFEHLKELVFDRWNDEIDLDEFMSKNKKFFTSLKFDQTSNKSPFDPMNRHSNMDISTTHSNHSQLNKKKNSDNNNSNSESSNHHAADLLRKKLLNKSCNSSRETIDKKNNNDTVILMKQQLSHDSIPLINKDHFAQLNGNDIQDMLAQEKLVNSNDINRSFIQLSKKTMSQIGSDFELKDKFKLHSNKNKSSNDVAFEQKRQMVIESKCNLCMDSETFQQKLVILYSDKIFIGVPQFEPFVEDYLWIFPSSHISTSNMLDEDTYDEIKLYKDKLCQYFNLQNKSIIFVETCRTLKTRGHFYLEVIPVNHDVISEAPMYFKKGILECEGNWNVNKKLIEMNSNNGCRDVIPKGLPYFSVEFMSFNSSVQVPKGFCHVIEDEKRFPIYFAREIIGGIMDLNPRVWLNPQRPSFDKLLPTVKKFTEYFKSIDLT